MGLQGFDFLIVFAFVLSISCKSISHPPYSVPSERFGLLKLCQFVFDNQISTYKKTMLNFNIVHQIIENGWACVRAIEFSEMKNEFEKATKTLAKITICCSCNSYEVVHTVPVYLFWTQFTDVLQFKRRISYRFIARISLSTHIKFGKGFLVARKLMVFRKHNWIRIQWQQKMNGEFGATATN